MYFITLLGGVRAMSDEDLNLVKVNDIFEKIIADTKVKEK